MELPFDNVSFDAAVASFVFMFVPEPAAGLKEMARVLRPGGRAVISVWQGLASNEVYSELVRIVSEVVDKKAGESIAWPFSLGAEGVLENLFNEAGLSPVSINTHSGTAKFPSINEFVKTEIQSWLLADSVTMSDIDEIANCAETAFDKYRNASGVMEFPFDATVALYVKP
jgi:SAM-dependent methyltransferase